MSKQKVKQQVLMQIFALSSKNLAKVISKGEQIKPDLQCRWNNFISEVCWQMPSRLQL